MYDNAFVKVQFVTEVLQITEIRDTPIPLRKVFSNISILAQLLLYTAVTTGWLSYGLLMKMNIWRKKKKEDTKLSGQSTIF